MPRNIVGAADLSMQIQREPKEYDYEAKLIKLRQINGWNFAKASRRGRMEIMAEILLFCSQQKAKTKIMYNINLNYAQLKSHLRSLTAQGLLATNKDKYATTQKGYRFLTLFAQLHDMLNY
jgi:predicted transcriptional regulator